GICRICGASGKLSYEHLPPKAAFNDRNVIKLSGNKLIGIGPMEYPSGLIQQGGAGDYTICQKCNNNTGTWYGKNFVNWCYQGMEYLLKTNGKPTLYYMYYIFPLRIVKQLITMFFSVNSPTFRQKNHELEKFVLNKEKKYLSPEYRLYAYYNISNKCRYVGVTHRLKLDQRKSYIFCEINFPPFGYVLTLNSDPPDERLADITYFAKYSYSDFKVMNIRMPVLETHLAYPGDYRTKDEITKALGGIQYSSGRIGSKVDGK
ncbi:MAG: hypothetical protein KAR20_18600, partial [Candidatus Heimdallarchaeota archaeon]|nr:hypothetical protein [Candidatus Heimdallarchaeota archaeon]